MLVEHGFEYAAQIQGRPQIAVVQQRRARKSGPVGNHASAVHGAAREKGATARPMIGAPRAIYGGGAAELRHDKNRGLLPQGPQLVGERSQRLVEPRQSLRNSSPCTPLIRVG